MSEIYRGAPPPAGPVVPVYDVVSPAAGEVLDLTILDGSILGTSCHWVTDPATQQSRSRLCLKDEGDCVRCGRDRPQWLGWVACLDNRRRTRVVLRLGAESAVKLGKMAVQHFGLRGTRLEVSRPEKGRTAALVFAVSPLAAGNPLPGAHSIERTVCMVLGCTNLPDMRVGREDAIPTGEEVARG